MVCFLNRNIRKMCMTDHIRMGIKVVLLNRDNKKSGLILTVWHLKVFRLKTFSFPVAGRPGIDVIIVNGNLSCCFWKSNG